MELNKLYKEQNINVEWDDRTRKAIGFTSGPQAERFIRYICQKVAPNKLYEKTILIPSSKYPKKEKIDGWENGWTKQH